MLKTWVQALDAGTGKASDKVKAAVQALQEAVEADMGQ